MSKSQEANEVKYKVALKLLNIMIYCKSKMNFYG